MLQNGNAGSQLREQESGDRLELSDFIQVQRSRKRQRQIRNSLLLTWRGRLLIEKTSWLSRIGASGSAGFYTIGKFLHQSIWLSLGIRLPFDLLSKIVSFELITCHPNLYWSDIHILSGRIRVRNLVHRHTEFLQACLRADLPRVRWHLEYGLGNINDVDLDGASALHVRLNQSSTTIADEQSMQLNPVRRTIQSSQL